MAITSFRIELPEPEGPRQGGERLTGQVIIEVDADTEARGLEVSLGWRTHGKGNTDRKDVDAETLGVQALTAGVPRRVPFTLTLANGPASYHGHLVNVDWYLTAKLDLPWARDPKATEDVLVVPSSLTRYEAGEDEAVANANPSAQGIERQNFLWPIAFSVALCGVAAGLLWYARFAEDSFGVFVGGAICGAIGAAALFGTLKRVAARGALGEVGVLLTPTHVEPGGALRLDLHVAPERDLALSRVVATLVATETAVQGSGTNKTTHTHPVYEKQYEVTGPTQVLPGQPRDFRLELVVPEDAPLTFAASDNKVSWRVRIAFEVPSWPDWHEERSLLVVPSRARPA